MGDVVERLRRYRYERFTGTYYPPICSEAADTIEALRQERDAALAEVERLREALVDHNDLLRSARAIAKREGVDGQIASTNWDAYYNRVAVALKRHHQITNDARTALRPEGQEG